MGYLKNVARILFLFWVLFACWVFTRRSDFHLSLEMSSTVPSIAQLYYDSGHGYSEAQAPKASVTSNSLNHFQSLRFHLPAKTIRALRFDPLMTAGTVVIRNILIEDSGSLLLKIAPSDIVPFNQISKIDASMTGVEVSTIPAANDPGVTLRLHGAIRLRRMFVLRSIRRVLAGLGWLLLMGVVLGIARQQVLKVARVVRAFLAQISASIISSSRRKDALCCTVLALLVFAAYVPLWMFSISYDPIYSLSELGAGSQMLPGHTSVDPNSGFTTEALGHLSADDWLQGLAPWWNPYTGVGLPLAGEMQTSSLFLPFVLLLHFGNGVLYLKIALQIVAGTATYLLLRRLGLSRFAAFLGGALYQFNGTFAWFAHAPITPIAFLPILLLGIELACESAEQRRRGGWAIIAIAIAYSLYAGFPEGAFLDGLLGLVWAIQRVVVARPGARFALAGKILVGGTAGVLLAAPAIVPFLQYLHLAGPEHKPGTTQLPNAADAAFLLPYIFGPIDAFRDADVSGQLTSLWGKIGGYVDVVPFFLGVLGLLTGKRDRGLRWTIALWQAPFVLRSINFPGFFRLFHAIPGMDLIASYRYTETSWEIAAAVLAAYAIDDWQRGTGRRFFRILLPFSITAGCAVAAIWIAAPMVGGLMRGNPAYAPWFWGSVVWAAVSLLLTAVLCSARYNQTTRRRIGVVIVADAMVFFSCPLFAGVEQPRIDLAPVTFLQQHLGLQRFYTLGPIRPNYAAYFRIASINHNIPATAGNWTRYIESELDPGIDLCIFVGNSPPRADREAALRSHLMNFEDTGVKYVVTESGNEPFLGGNLMGAKPRRVFQDSDVAIFELPRAGPYFEASGGACDLAAASRDRVRARCQAPAALIRRELFYPGWRAAVNGHDFPVTSTDSIFQAINLPKGDSTVIFSYHPSYSAWSGGAALIGVALLLSDMILRRRRLSRPMPQEISSVAHLAK